MMDMMKGLEVHIDSQFETMGNKLDAKVDKLEATHWASIQNFELQRGKMA